MTATAELTLPPEPETVGRARRAVRNALNGTANPDLVYAAELVTSELVTNAVVHAATDVHLHITTEPAAIRVEIEDGSVHLPVRRTWSATSGTGRGLLIVDEHVDRWSAARTAHGKVVWFEIGEPLTAFSLQSSQTSPRAETVEVTLLNVPLLMHWAWQEHATTLLREFLLFTLDEDPQALDHHAAASDALSILREQLPDPRLPTDPDALMASSVEPTVSADRVALKVPGESTRHFEILDHLLATAVDAARQGRLLGPPTQPEISEMREWLCGEVAGQARGAEPTPWRARTDVRVALPPDAALADSVRELMESEAPLIATNDESVIVAVTPSLVTFLGYRDEAELLGRRILVVVPARFHQAHISGTTLHVTNGRDALLGLWIEVPMTRADGTEVVVGLHVQPQRLEGGQRLFVAHVRLPGQET